ncbi:MAG: hypothetical protein OEW21_01105 [Betaproteobacteria bacterium]|nr:hypothetical protein [Betaproteobacteria bacterium]
MRVIALLAGAWLLGGCTSVPRTGAPADFGAYEGVDSLQAASFDRVVYQVKRVENKPYADLAFWQVALKERLVKAGYVVTAEGAIEAGGQKGYYLETTVPRGSADYSYLVALFVKDKNLVLIESAGELAAYRAKREKIFAAIRASEPGGGR